MMFRHGWAFALLLAAAGAGCSGSPTGSGPRGVTLSTPSPKGKPVTGPPKPPHRPAEGSSGKPSGRPENPAVSATREAGVISGFVRWDGPLPPAAREDPQASGDRSATVAPTPRVLADPKTGGLANVIVWLDNPPPQDSGGGNRPGAGPASLSLVQRRGNYDPHVQAVRTGTLLELGTVDDRADFRARGAVTFSEVLVRGERRSFRLSDTGPVEVRSDPHPWRTPAYLRVLDHSYHAVTGTDGRFRLPPVPAGEYRLMLWHESGQAPDPKKPGGWAPLEARVSVKVGSGAGAEVHWTLPAR
jgi:hypothetical protein